MQRTSKVMQIKLNVSMHFFLENTIPTTCRESYYAYVKNALYASPLPNPTPPEMVFLFSPPTAMTEEATAKFVKLLDILVGNTAVALAPIETLTLDGYNPGEYKVLPTTTGRYATYEVGRLKLAYTAIPTHLTLFDPMIMSVLYGLAKAAHLLMFWGLEEDVLSSVSEEDIVSAIKNRYRDKAYLNMFQALSVLYKINKQYKILGVDNIMRQRSDVTAILRLRAKLRDLPLSGIKNNWLAPYKYDTGRYLFHNWKKDKCPDVWSHRRAPAQ